ncbi:m7GpppX diphosphatase [Nematostella vectensis]|uniref:m7GpppX diphosphatase n=1 Tax=Nematostella vectensis TaxID=45351 RepID=UPI002076FE5A|nr:m7GpppX diphosphatase [Nematostella vectensis]
MADDGDQICAAKKPRLTGQGDGLENFDKFEVIKVLSENVQGKSVCVHGKFQSCDDDAVVLLEKTPFSARNLPIVLSKDTKLSVDMRNDVYGQYIGYPAPTANTIKTTVIYPATAQHIAKYTSQDVFFVYESPELYKTITLPFFEAQKFSIQWVYNILEKKAETERVVFEDGDPETGFVLLPDMKWDQQQVENLYLIAICHKRGIKSLRDLNEEHIPLLKNILNKGRDAIRTKYNVPHSQLRIYVHYQPSYYHFHVHFTHLKFDAPGLGSGKAHLLSDIIDNISTIDSGYYQKKTLPCILREHDKLYQEFKQAGNV